MSVPTLTPISNTNISRLTSTGSAADVNSGCPFGIYSDPSADLYSANFISGAVDQVTYTYRKLGGDILDLEILPKNVYSAYEESVLEYSYIMNIHQAKNILSDALGNTTGSFDSDGTLISGSLKTSLSGTHINLKYPKFDFGYARRIAETISGEAFVGGNDTVYSASFSISDGIQDYNLQSIVSASSAAGGVDFAGLVGDKKILIKKVFYKTPSAMWRFYGFGYGGLSVAGNLGDYGMFSDSSTFEVVPVWQQKAQAMAFEDAIYTRCSHYSYEIHNNNLRLYPRPFSSNSPSKFWIQFVIPGDAWTEDTDSVNHGIDGVNNIGTLPFGNIPFESINAIGKQWVRRFALSLTKEILGQVRGKFQTLPIPNNNVTLNAEALLAQAKEEQDNLRKELIETLDKLTYASLVEQDAKLIEDSSKIYEKVPMRVYVG